jgi:hypothetical protein
MTEEEWERRAFENEIMAAKRGMVHVYLFEVPNEVPAGLRLVHNFPPGRPHRAAGDYGFRYWLEADTPNAKGHHCECGWDAPAHWSH